MIKKKSNAYYIKIKKIKIQVIYIKIQIKIQAIK